MERVYRLMKRAQLLLRAYGSKPERLHNGKVITLASDLRWSSGVCEIRCWNGEKVRLGFALDCCDREVMAWVATDGHLDGGDIRDLMAQPIEARFDTVHTPHPIEWLSDNGPPYVAHETKAFGAASGLLVRNTPAYSPESNGLAEAFVKTFKRDYVYVNDVSSAAVVLAQLPAWLTKTTPTRVSRSFPRGNSTCVEHYPVKQGQLQSAMRGHLQGSTGAVTLCADWGAH